MPDEALGTSSPLSPSAGATGLLDRERAPAPGAVCPNCGEPIRGRYCSRCGQDQAAQRTFRDLLRDFVSDVFDADSRLWRTLRILVTRPGQLSLDHREGRRARYLAPVRLYLLSSLVFFATVAFAPVQLVQVGTADPNDDSPVGVSTGSGVTIEGDAMNELIARGEADPERLNDVFVRSLAWAMFLLIPIFAALLKLLFHSTGLLYVEHLVFALHYHAFGFLAQSVGYAAMHLPIEGASTPLLLMPHVANAAYMFLAFRRFYRTGPVRTLVRMAALGFCYILVVSIAMVATAAIALHLI